MASKWELVINIVARAFKYIINSNIAIIAPPILSDLNLLLLLTLMFFYPKNRARNDRFYNIYTNQTPNPSVFKGLIMNSLRFLATQ